MIASVAFDVVSGPSRPIALILLGFFSLIVVMEGGILALMGMRPVGKAFTSSFLSNIAAGGAGFLFWMVMEILNLQGNAFDILVLLAAMSVQGLVLLTQRQNLSKTRIWLSVVAMKLSSVVVTALLVNFLDL